MTFANPAFAILATAALIASLALSAYFYMGRKNALARFASPQILPKLSSSTSKVKIFSKAALFALGISAALLALARPQWGYKWEEVKQKGVDIIFAVDTSKSMMAEDVKPNRLERAKLAISDVIERLGGDRIGLVAFSGQAFLQCPITLDYDAFKMSLEALDTNIIQRGGTNIAAAIEEAEGAFSSSKNQKILILISDGEELEQSGVSAAERAAKEKGMKIYTLGVGGAGGEAIPVRGKYGKIDFLRDESGKPVSSRLNEDLLKKVAAAAGGIYANLSEDGMEAIYEEGLKKAPKSEISSRMK
ncbi:MAG: VWA domain-containing protein, partial [Opitutales bacterium]|nr:VWA domain-containing protein [Opitutales bacterium]